jgi:uncharacterized membrane protein YeaQ/YmgE (transglycosylase-associated protein family)
MEEPVSILSLLTWAVFGAIAGGIARALVPGRVPGGWLPTIALGIAGSIAGGLPFGTGPAGLLGSVVGAVVVVVIHSWYVENNS